MGKFFITLLGVSTVFLLSSATASAHVIVKPEMVGVASFQTFNVSVPNETSQPMQGLRVRIPDNLSYVSATVKLGWAFSEKRTGDKVTELDWNGGTIPAGQRDDFSFSAQVPAQVTTLQWKAYQTFADGTVTAWDQALQKNSDGSMATTSENGHPFSETQVVNDLATPATTTASPLWLGLLTLVVSLVGLVMSLRKK